MTSETDTKTDRRTVALKAYCGARLAGATADIAREACWTAVATLGDYARPPAAPTFSRWIAEAEDMVNPS